MWALPPIVTGHPGADYNCRCIAEPDMSESLIESLQQGAEAFAEQPTEAAASPPEGRTMKHRLRHRNDPTGKRTVRTRREGEEPVFRALVTGLKCPSARGRGPGTPPSADTAWSGTDVYDGGWFTESFRQGRVSRFPGRCAPEDRPRPQRRIALARSPKHDGRVGRRHGSGLRGTSGSPQPGPSRAVHRRRAGRRGWDVNRVLAD